MDSSNIENIISSDSKVCDKPIDICFIEDNTNPSKYIVNVAVNILEIISSQIYSESKRKLYFKLKNISKNKGKAKINVKKHFATHVECDLYTFEPEDIEIGTVIYLTDTTEYKTSKYPLKDDVKFARPIELECGLDDSKLNTILEKRITDVKDLKQMFIELFNNLQLGFIKCKDIRFTFTRSHEYKFNKERYYLVHDNDKEEKYAIIGYIADQYTYKFEWFMKGCEHIVSDVIDSDSITIYYSHQKKASDPLYFKIQLNYGSIEKGASDTIFYCNDEHSMNLDIPQEVKIKTLESFEEYEILSRTVLSEIKEAILKSSNHVTMKRSDDCISMIEIRNSKTILEKFIFKLEVGYNRLLCIPIERYEKYRHRISFPESDNSFGYIPFSEVMGYYKELFWY